MTIKDFVLLFAVVLISSYVDDFLDEAENVKPRPDGYIYKGKFHLTNEKFIGENFNDEDHPIPIYFAEKNKK
jgi:hypothetical protein